MATEKPPPPEFDGVRTDDISCYCSANGYVSLLEYALINGTLPTYDSSYLAARNGSLDCLKVLKKFGLTFSNSVLHYGALSGHIVIFKYLMSLGMAPSQSSFDYAVQSGNIELFKFLQMECPEIDLASNPEAKYLGSCATVSGNLEMVKYIEQYFPLEPSYIAGSAVKGSIDILQYFLDKGFTLTEDTTICAKAAIKKQWTYLKFALDHGAPMSAQLMANLAKHNAVNLMRELRQKGCPWSMSAVRGATVKGHLEALKFLIENGCPFTEQNCDLTTSGSFTESSEATVIAAGINDIQCLKYLIDIGAPMPEDIIDQCIRPWTNGAVITYLRERGCSWSATTSAVAVSFYNIALLKYLHENDCPWDEQTAITAALEASVECLKYALDNGCPCGESTMDEAATYGSLEVLKICHEKGIPWTNQTCSLLSRVDMLKYAIDNGCPWDPQSTLDMALSSQSEDIAQWILENYNVSKPADSIDL